MGAPSRRSLPVVFCLQDTQLHTSTTCIVFGPSKLLQEAPSGLNNNLGFLFVDFCFLITFFPFLIILLLHISLALFSLPIPFCSGVHHSHTLLCNQSSASFCWPMSKSETSERNYHLQVSYHVKEHHLGPNLYVP